MTVDEEPQTIEAVIAVMVDTDGYDRAKAFSVAATRGWAGIRVHDLRCGHVLTLLQLLRHLMRTDNASIVESRGHRMHTPINVVPHDPESGGHGPGMAGP